MITPALLILTSAITNALIVGAALRALDHNRPVLFAVTNGCAVAGSMLIAYGTLYALGWH